MFRDFMTMATSRINMGVYIKKSLVERIDCLRGDIPRSRVVEKVLEEKFGISGGEDTLPSELNSSSVSRQTDLYEGYL